MNSKVFADRRQRYFDRTEPDAVTVLFAQPVAQRNQDVEFPYRPDSDLYYLTGFPEPEAVAVLCPGNPQQRFTLFVRPRDPAKEVWNGLRAGVDGAVSRFGADAAYPIDELSARLPALLENVPTLYHRMYHQPAHDRHVMAAIQALKAQYRSGVTWPITFRDPAEVLGEMRLIKHPEDVEVLRLAAKITADAHSEAMRAAAPGLNEYHVQAVVEFVFRKSGALGWGYPSICGSGPNSCILHYVENDRQLQDGDLLLIDAGAEVDYFTGDCTRTFPVNGRFSPEQRAVYEVVLESQKAGTEAVRPGNTFMDVHNTSLRVIVDGLIRLGLLEGPAETAIEKETYKPFFMHRTSHWLGMDVHDAGRYRDRQDWRRLEPGMLLTVEPGIYIAAGMEGVDPKWWNIGIRIEDDVLVTPEGHEVLTSDVPKEIEEIERLCGERCRYL